MAYRCSQVGGRKGRQALSNIPCLIQCILCDRDALNFFVQNVDPNTKKIVAVRLSKFSRSRKFRLKAAFAPASIKK